MRGVKRLDDIYRGIDIDTGSWIEGKLDPKYNQIYLEFGDERMNFDVFKDTISKWSYFRDRVGYKVFEGDILKITRGNSEYKAKVVIWRGYFRVEMSLFGQKKVRLLDLINTGHKIEVVGNVYNKNESW